jgi:hypothetical protein
MESQRHGFDFENEVIYQITGFFKEEYEKKITNSYTSSMDIVKGVHSEYDYSIKVSKNGRGIGGGDILRFNKHCEKGFKLIVGCWNQKNSSIKVYDCIYEFTITPKDYKKLWGSIPLDELKNFVNYVKSIPSGKEAQKKNTLLWKEKRDILYHTYDKGVVDIAAKIDSVSQRRVQCSMRLEELISSGIDYVKYTKSYKGIKLPYEQKSTSRKFKKA